MESKVGLCLYAISPFSPSLFYQQNKPTFLPPDFVKFLKLKEARN